MWLSLECGSNWRFSRRTPLSRVRYSCGGFRLWNCCLWWVHCSCCRRQMNGRIRTDKRKHELLCNEHLPVALSRTSATWINLGLNPGLSHHLWRHPTGESRQVSTCDDRGESLRVACDICEYAGAVRPSGVESKALGVFSKKEQHLTTANSCLPRQQVTVSVHT